MADPLYALERIMEEAVEGTVQRLFRPKLQPVQLAKAAARRMDEGQVVGPSGPEVPNNYTISLHPRDFERFARYQVALQGELQKYLVKYARDHGWRPIGDIAVALVVDSAVPPGRAQVLAQMLDAAGQVVEPSAKELDAPIEQTVRQQRVEAPRRLADGVWGSLLNEDGEHFELVRPVVTIGRALENDVVIPDERVSRFHAEIRKESDRVVVADLGSTNGTWVAEETVDRRQLRHGESISLGGYRLKFRQT
jgi:hypothetical protein